MGLPDIGPKLLIQEVANLKISLKNQLFQIITGTFQMKQIAMEMI